MSAAHTIRVAEVFGTVASIRLVGDDRRVAAAERAAEALLTDLADVDRVLSPFRDDSDLSRVRRGELRLADADARLGEVARLCADYERRSGGLFSAMWNGGFDPTGLVKGWAVENAAITHLRPLLGSGVQAIGVNVGGDMRLFTAADVDHTWRVGIADPGDAGRIAAVVTVRDGAVATSGTAERGAHIVDPRTSRPVTAATSATVIAPTLTDADAWATAAIVAGIDDVGWIRVASETTGVLLAANGRSQRWMAGVEVSIEQFRASSLVA